MQLKTLSILAAALTTVSARPAPNLWGQLTSNAASAFSSAQATSTLAKTGAPAAATSATSIAAPGGAVSGGVSSASSVLSAAKTTAAAAPSAYHAAPSAPAPSTTGAAPAKNDTGPAAPATGGSGKPIVVYWGQNKDDPDLGDLCKDPGVAIVVLSFITQYGGGGPVGENFGSHCDAKGNCPGVTSGMQACRAAGKKVYISVGGWENKGTINSTKDAESIADGLWGMFGPPGKGNGPRAFGDQYVDGFDFDLEHTDSTTQYYPALITRLRSHFTGGDFEISGAPMCSLTSTSMTSMVHDAKFDKLFVQFYNAPCAAAGNSFNLDQFPSYLSGGASVGAQVYVGLPSAQPAAQTGYIAPPQLETFLNKYKGDAEFAGVMLWDAGNAMTNKQNNCNYIQQVQSILTTGKAC